MAETKALDVPPERTAGLFSRISESLPKIGAKGKKKRNEFQGLRRLLQSIGSTPRRKTGRNVGYKDSQRQTNIFACERTVRQETEPTMNHHRPDKWFERALRKFAVLLAFLLWCTVGLAIWVFIATRVTVAFSSALFYSAFKHTDIKAAEGRLLEGLHWWSDGFQRIRSSLTAEDFSYPQVSSFVFWQECFYVAVMLLILAIYHFAMPTSQAIYTVVHERLLQPASTSVVNAAHSNPQVEHSGAEPKMSASVLPQPTESDKPPRSAPIPETNGGASSNSLPVAPLDLPLQTSEDSSAPNQPANRSDGPIKMTDDPSTFTTGIFDVDGNEIERPLNPVFDTTNMGFLYLEPHKWSNEIPRPPQWVVSFRGIESATKRTRQDIVAVDVEWALNGDVQNTFTSKLLDEEELRPKPGVIYGYWKRTWAAKSIRLRNTSDSPVWFALFVLPPGSTP